MRESIESTQEGLFRQGEQSFHGAEPTQRAQGSGALRGPTTPSGLPGVDYATISQ